MLLPDSKERIHSNMPGSKKEVGSTGAQSLVGSLARVAVQAHVPLIHSVPLLAREACVKAVALETHHILEAKHLSALWFCIFR